VNEAWSEGTLLGGRLVYRQKLEGYRTGIEPLLLAACVPARAGEHVVEAGTGAGPGLLALHARVPGVIGLGIERNPELAALADANFNLNGASTLKALCEDIENWQPDGPCDHAFANPPWHRDDGTPTPYPGRHSAKFAHESLLSTWICKMSASLRRRGTLTLVLPAASFAQAVAALATCHCAEIRLLPLWPHQGEGAKLIILQAMRDGRGASRILPGLVLHEADGAYTRQATAILRDGGGLVL
jgi:tRNA1Val (adenine37-N6)-methyltransferase